MPIYSYTSDCGKTVELMMTLPEKEAREDADKCIEIDGIKYRRDIAADQKKGSVRSGDAGWPIYSEAAACHPSRIQEYREASIARGVPTEYDKIGRPKFENPSHRKKYLKKFGLRDLNGFD